MEILRCDEVHNDRWNAFVRSSELGTFYHLAEWRNVNERCFGHRTCHLAAADDDGRIIGIFPIVDVRSAWFGKIACSMPFVNFGGPCAENETVERALLDAAERLAEEWQVDYLEIRTQRRLGDRYSSSEHKVSMTVELAADPDTLWNAFKTGHRQEIRRGYKNGFTARFGGAELIDDFYLVLSESWRDLGTPIFSKTYLVDIHATFPNATRICVVYDGNGNPAAGAFDGLHSGIVEGMWLGVRSAYKRHLVGYVLYLGANQARVRNRVQASPSRSFLN